MMMNAARYLSLVWFAVCTFTGEARGADWFRFLSQYSLDANSGTEGSYRLSCAAGYTVWNNQLYWAIALGDNGCELVALGDLDVDPYTLADVNPGPGSGRPSDVTPCGNLLFFVGRPDGFDSDQLWATDGTSAGTYLVADINPSGDEKIDVPECIAGELYFSADDGVHGAEVWSSDGTL